MPACSQDVIEPPAGGIDHDRGRRVVIGKGDHHGRLGLDVRAGTAIPDWSAHGRLWFVPGFGGDAHSAGWAAHRRHPPPTATTGPALESAASDIRTADNRMRHMLVVPLLLTSNAQPGNKLPSSGACRLSQLSAEHVIPERTIVSLRGRLPLCCRPSDLGLLKVHREFDRRFSRCRSG